MDEELMPATVPFQVPVAAMPDEAEPVCCVVCRQVRPITVRRDPHYNDHVQNVNEYPYCDVCYETRKTG